MEQTEEFDGNLLVEEENTNLLASNLKKINKRFIQIINQEVQDARNEDNLVDVAQNCFCQILQFINSVPNYKISKELTNFAQSIRTKISDFHNEKEAKLLLNRKIFSAFVDQFIQTINDQRLTFSGAYALINLFESLLQNDKLSFKPDMVNVLLTVIYFLQQNEEIFLTKSHSWYKKFINSDDFNQEQLKQSIKDHQKLIKYTYLSYFANNYDDKPMKMELVQDFNKIVLNDKEKQQIFNLQFFIPLLNELEEDLFLNEIFPQMEFIMKRNGQLINVICVVFKHFYKIQFTSEIIKMITTDLLSNSYILSDDTYKESSQLFSEISKKIDNVESSKSLLIDYLLKKFQETKQSDFSQLQRQRIFKHIKSVLQHLNISKDKIQQSIQQITIFIIEHIFQTKDEPVLREIFEDVSYIITQNENLQFVNEGLKPLINKATNLQQIAIFNEILISTKVPLGEIIQTVQGKFKTMLSSENYASTVNYQTILALAGFFSLAYQHTQDNQYIQILLDNEGFMNYICTPKGYVNQLGYFKKNPSIYDTKYHLKIIQILISIKNDNSPLVLQNNQLGDTLFEYVLNDNYTYREHQVIECFQQLCQTLKNNSLLNLLTSLLIKVRQIEQRPKEIDAHLTNNSSTNKLKTILKFIISNLKNQLNQDDFIKLIKIVCNPVISKNQRDLIILQKEIDKAYGNVHKNDVKLYERQKESMNLLSCFDKYSNELIKFAIMDRTGLLSPHDNLRKQAINIVVMLAVYGKMDLFIAKLGVILNFKPLDMLTKINKVFQSEFDRITFYDLMYYSDTTKDLIHVFKETDDKIINIEKELVVTQKEENKVQGQEEEKQDFNQNIDPQQLIASQLKKAASQKKGAAVKKGVPQKAPVKQNTVKENKPSQKQEFSQIQAMSKEQRNKLDRQQIINYISEVQKIKGKQIETVLEAIKRANMVETARGLNYLDNILFYVLQPAINLLHFSSSRFSTINFLSSIFEHNKSSPFFKIKNPILNSLLAISANKMFQKNMREFSQIFQHLNDSCFSDMEKGYLQLILLMTNFVLKDLSVNLSVKEDALEVTNSILKDNQNVQYIDLVRVTINMMKSSYINDNLSQFLRDLIQKISKEELALMLQRLFDYEPIPRMKFLQQLERYDLPLFCPVWFSTQLWILQFDEDRENLKIAKQLWNKYGMVLRTGNLDLQQEESNKNIFFYLRSKNTQIFDASIKAAVAAIEIFQNRFDLIIDDLIEFYNNELTIIDQISIQNSLEAQNQFTVSKASKMVTSDQRLQRIAVPEILKRTAHLVQANSFKKLFEFFITQGCLDQNETVSKKSMEAAIKIIQTKGQDYSEELLRILEKYINEQKKYSEQSKNQSIILIGALSNYLDNTSQKKLFSTFEKMLEILHTPSELIRQSICKCIPQIARFFDDKSKKALEENFKIIREGTDEKQLRGCAFAISGIVKGLGMQIFTEYDILNIVHKECFHKHSDPLRKQGGLYLYETLSLSLGKSFELFIPRILPDILAMISDAKEPVRRAAIQANKVLMSNFSNYAIKQVLPLFLKGLENENWRSKLASVEALGNMAYCAPKQISSFLPQIVKGIREVLNDTHEKVHDAALEAIKNIGSVIKCPEIADILEVLIKSLSNPNLYLVDALKVLLNTSFVHAIDAPSLSLLVPILDHGLMMHDNQSKHLASTLMGNICSLTQDPQDLLPYMKILMPAIKNSLFDSIPEIRASAAKALGSLSRGLGLENSQDMLNWIKTVLHQKGLATSERNGAAQGFAEIISVHGQQFFENQIREIIEKARDQDGGIRESYRGVMVFLPTSFDQFVKYLPQVLPIMIEGLSDDIEEVRKISLRNVKICIKQFGKQAPTQLVTPIMQMMFDNDFRVRQSSSILMYQLTKELENDVIKLQPKYITIEVKNEILSSMFILRYDTIEKVSIQACQIWKNIIDNSLKVLRLIISEVINQSFNIIMNEQLELQEMGLNCMRGLVEKFGEKLVIEALGILEIYFEKATEIQQMIGVSKVIYNMTQAAPIKLLTDLRNRFISIIDQNLSHEMEEIRNLSAKVFITVFQKTFEPIYMSQVLDKSIIKKIHHFVAVGEYKEADLIIQALKVMLKSAPELRLEDKLLHLCNIQNLDSPLTIAQSKVITAVAPIIAANVFKRKLYNAVMDALTNELQQDIIDDEVRINEVLTALSELIASIPENDIMSVNEEIDKFHSRCKEKNRLNLYVDLIAYYCKNSKVNYENYASTYMKNVLVLMNDQDEKLVDKVIVCLNAIFDGLPKESQSYLVPLVKQVIQELGIIDINITEIYRKKVETLKIFEKASGVKSFVSVLQNAIMHGSIEIRIDSAICFKYLIDFSKPEAIKGDIIKICGALIRVVNDKFIPELKIQIFLSLKLILLKANQAVKAMVPQLQTTFLKAFNDPLATPQLRKLVIEDLLLLIKIIPKADPIVKELASYLEGDKLDKESKIEVSEALLIIIKNNGKAIQQTIQAQLQTTIQSILTSKRSQFNDKTIVNCSLALAILLSYSQTSEQLNSVFNSYDSIYDIRLSLGIKVGIIIAQNGHDQQKLYNMLEEYILEQLKKMSGIKEIDDNTWIPYDDNIEIGRLIGTIEILGFIGDIVIRRFGYQDTSLLKVFYGAVNKSEILLQLNSADQLSKQSLYSMMNYFSQIPVKCSQISDQNFSKELQVVLKYGFMFIHKFYLELNSKKDVQPAYLNMLMLNYNNLLDINDENKIEVLSKDKIRKVCESSYYQDIVESDKISLYAELLFL